MTDSLFSVNGFDMSARAFTLYVAHGFHRSPILEAAIWGDKPFDPRQRARLAFPSRLAIASAFVSLVTESEDVAFPNLQRVVALLRDGVIDGGIQPTDPSWEF